MKKRGEYYVTQFFYLNLQTLIFIGKMKQLKFLMVALTLLMGISFTSCLDSDDSPAVGYSLGRCVASYPPRFYDLATGKELILSGSVTTMYNVGDIYSFYYTVPEGQATDAKEYTVLLYNNNEPVRLSAKSSEGPMPDMGGEANVPMYMLTGNINTNYGSSAVEPVLCDFGGYMYLMLTPVFWYKNETSSDALKKEIEKHSFIISYNEDEIKAGDTELVLTLNHVVTDPAEKRERWSYLDLRAYSLESAISAFQEKTGNKPAQIKVVALVNNSSNSLEGATEQTWTHEVKQN